MKTDIISETLKKYFIEKGKNLKVIQRYLRVKYRLIMDEQVLKRRIKNLSVN